MVWAWGDNQFGNLGDGSTANSDVPVQGKALTNVKFIAGGRDHSLAIGTTANRLKPVRVTGVTGGEEVEWGRDSSVALVQS